VTRDLDVAVIGAGIAGLSLAYRLGQAGRSVRVFEAAAVVGGRMATVRHQGYAIDAGAEQIPTHGYDATWSLLADLGITRDRVPLIGSGVGVWRDGRAHHGVADPRGLLTGAGLPAGARLDLFRFQLGTALRRRRFDPDRPEDTPLGLATVADLGRRYHPDLARYLFDPVATAFFGWDPLRSAAAPFVSLLAAVGPAGGWRTYRGGMDLLARRLAERVDVHTGLAVTRVVAEVDGARLATVDGEYTARQVVLCVPAPVARELYANPPAAEAAHLDECTFTPMVKVSCLLDRPLAPAAKRPLYVLLTPGDDLLAGLVVDHAKHPDRAPHGGGLITLLSRPQQTVRLLDAPDEEAHVLLAHAERYVPGIGAATVTSLVHRHRHALPEATPRALAGRAAFARRPAGPVDYAGDWVQLRPSSEGAVRAAALAADRILSRRPSHLTTAGAHQ